MEKTGSFLSRRKLIVAAGGTAAAAAALVSLPLRTGIVSTLRDLGRPALAPRTLISLPTANYDIWLDQVGSIFSVGGGTSLKLIAVTALNSAGPRPAGLARDRAFIAKFDVQNGGTMAGDLIYTASHPQYGAFRIFLSASTDPNLTHRMTALFN